MQCKLHREKGKIEIREKGGKKESSKEIAERFPRFPQFSLLQTFRCYSKAAACA